jgi:carbamoyl-phosphate synthase large subunit
MFPEVDPILGPEMRSTGEVLGLADSFGLAYFKAQEAAQAILPVTGTVLISVNDPDKQAALEVARKFTEIGFGIKATAGTHKFLEENGVSSEMVLKLFEGRPNLVDQVTNGEIQLIINTASGKRSKFDDSYIRKTAIRNKIPYITTMTAASASVRGIADYLAGNGENGVPKSLQEYHQLIIKL